jgi:hypothetical protein
MQQLLSMRLMDGFMQVGPSFWIFHQSRIFVKQHAGSMKKILATGEATAILCT